MQSDMLGTFTGANTEGKTTTPATIDQAFHYTEPEERIPAMMKRIESLSSLASFSTEMTPFGPTITYAENTPILLAVALPPSSVKTTPALFYGGKHTESCHLSLPKVFPPLTSSHPQ